MGSLSVTGIHSNRKKLIIGTGYRIYGDTLKYYYNFM